MSRSSLIVISDLDRKEQSELCSLLYHFCVMISHMRKFIIPTFSLVLGFITYEGCQQRKGGGLVKVDLYILIEVSRVEVEK